MPSPAATDANDGGDSGRRAAAVRPRPTGGGRCRPAKVGARSRDPDEIARESRAPCHDGAGLPLESRAGSDARRGGTRLSRRPRAAWCRRAAWTRRGESCRLQLRGSRVTAAAGGRPLALLAACLMLDAVVRLFTPPGRPTLLADANRGAHHNERGSCSSQAFQGAILSAVRRGSRCGTILALAARCSPQLCAPPALRPHSSPSG